MARSIEPDAAAARAARADAPPGSGIAARFAAFVAERFPFALAPAREAFRSACRADPGRDGRAIEELRQPLAESLARSLDGRPAEGIPETTPGVSAAERLRQARSELLDTCDGFLRRESLAAGLTREERIEILRGMILTRAPDNRLKFFFSGSEVRYRDTPFQGKGFRSLGQEHGISPAVLSGYVMRYNALHARSAHRSAPG